MADTTSPAAALVAGNTEVFVQTYDKLAAMVANKRFSASNWIALIPMAMEIVETIPNLHGSQKRGVVVDLLVKLISEIPMADEDRAIIMTLVRTALPAIIDTICDGTLGKIAVNIAEQVEEGARKCFAKCQTKKQDAPRQLRRNH